MSSVEEDPRYRVPRGSSDEEIDSDLASGQGSDNDSENEEALARVTAAVTTRDLSLKNARRVDPCTTDEPSKTVGGSSAETPSHPALIGRILQTIRSSATTEKTQSAKDLPKLQKKINRLHSDKATNLSVPLPAPVSARLERAAAYNQTATSLTDKWTDTVIRNRRADRLKFPLNGAPPLKQNIKDLNSAKKRHMVDHEIEIAEILEEAGVQRDKEVTKSEQNAVDDALSAGKLTKEEVLQRQRELARVRSMMFHYDQKMKRIKKIKSRKYRKEMKKDRERLASANADPLDSEGEKEESLAEERRRIEERVTQRHRNTSKWVRRQLQRGEAKRDESTRAAIEDQLRIHQELKRRQTKETGNGNDSSDDDYGSGDDDGSDGDDKEISNLEKELADPSDAPKSKKGVMALKFMQAAEERKRKEALALLNEMKEDSEDDDDDVQTANARRVFTGSKAQNVAEEGSKNANYTDDDEVDASKGDDDVDDDNVGDLSVKGAGQAVIDRQIFIEPEKQGAEGLDKQETCTPVKGGSISSGQTHMRHESSVLSNAARKRKRKGARDSAPQSASIDKNEGAGDALVQNIGQQPSKKRKTRTKRKKNIPQSVSTDKGAKDNAKNEPASPPNSKSDNGDKPSSLLDTSNRIVEPKPEKKKNGTQSPSNNLAEIEIAEVFGGVKGAEGTPADMDNDLSRMEEVAQAFAGVGGADLAEFEAAKATEIEEELPTAKSLNAEILPGWGAWDGAGTSEKQKQRRKQSPFVQAALEKFEAARTNAVKSRSDRDMRNVILDQKRHETATKMTLASVPYPYQSREQWERELSRPLCRELVSSTALRAGVKKKVDVRLGSALEPIQTPNPSRTPTKTPTELVKRKGSEGGKEGVINLRRAKAKHRAVSRRGLMS